MNHNIKYLILSLAVLGGLTACNKQLIEEPQAPVNTHRVYFSSSTAQTKTGITIAEGTMTPDWRATNADNVHLFEIGSNGYSVGKDVTITPADDNLTAHFKADFPTDMTIIVDPSKKNSLLTASNESNAGPYTYAAIVAQATESAYIVPAVQNPGAETLIDPSADFLIGYSRKSYDAAHNWEEDVVDLYFDRPVALGRINISSFEDAGEKVKSVVIKAPGLSGSAAYTAIDFENAAVTFTPDVAAEGETAALTLAYGDAGRALTDGTFDAYFVALPGKTTVSEIVVTTDKWVYTKTVGKEIAFSKDSFKNLTLNLASATKEAAVPTEIKWYKASVLEDGIDYLIVSEGYALKNNGSKAVVAAQAVEIVDGTISLEETDGLIWTANANSEFTEYGTHTLSNGTEHLWRHSNNGTFTLEANNEAITKYMVWNYDGEYLWNISIYTGSGSAQISDYYAYYSSGWKTSTTKTATTLYTRRAPQELTFTPAANAEYDLATSEWTVAVPTLSGAQTSVSYALSEDSNPAVATVDADGTVHPLSRGSVTIVATAAGNDQYQAATATYSLKVIDSNITTKTYNKVTSTADLTVGDKYLLVYEGGKKVFNPILDGNVFKKDGSNALDAEITDNTIVSDSFEESHLTLESGYFLKVDKYGDYLYPNVASSRGVLSAESAASHALKVSIGSNGVASIIAQSGTYYLVWSTSSNYFSSNTSIEGDYSTGICLYKLDDGRLPQTPSFSPAEVNYDMAGSAALVKPDLSNAIGTVTYSSSNAAVASVDASTGDVTVHGRGTVEIIATAAGNSQYKPGSASYTLVITNSSIIIPTWYKAEEIEDGETYLVISNGYALKNDGSSAGAAIDLGVSGDSFEYEADETVIWTATESSGKFRLGNNGKVLRLGTSSSTWGGSTTTFQIGTASTTESNNQWNLNEDALLMISNNYFYYSTGNSKWSINTSASSSHTAYLYGLHAGRQAQTLSFSATSVTYDIASSAAFTAPTISGAQTAVTYSSSNAAVATVNATTGAVEIVGTGTTIITANAEGTNAFKPATASYTLRVTDSSAPVTTKRYVLASSIEAGKNYIIVSGGYALKNNDGSVASVSVTPADGAIEFEPGTDDALVWTAATETSQTSYGHFTLSNGSYRLRRKSSSGSFSAQLVTTDTAMDKYDVWDLQTYNGDTYLFHDSSSTMRCWLYYSSGWKITYRSSKTDPSSTEKPTQLYVEENP